MLGATVGAGYALAAHDEDPSLKKKRRPKTAHLTEEEA
jgi:hypothetical protein